MDESCAMILDGSGDVQGADRQNAEGSHHSSDSSSEESSEETAEKLSRKPAAAKAIPDKRVGTMLLYAVAMYSRDAVSQRFCTVDVCTLPRAI